VVSRHYIFIAVALLTACGDSTQQFRAVDINRGSDGLAPSNSQGKTTPEFVPLASEYLRMNDEALGQSARLEDVRLSSTLGLLGENIQAGAEALGLTFVPGAFGISSIGSALPDGLYWEATSPAPAMQFAESGGNSDHGTISEMQLKLGDVPVHDARVKMVLERGETTWVSGSRPGWLTADRKPTTTPFSLSIEQARQYAVRALSFPEWRFHSPTKIYIAEQSRARAAYVFTVSAEYRAGDRAPWVPLEIAVDADTGKLLWQRPLAMHATGSTQLYIENKAVSTTLETVTLPDLISGSRLNHNLFDVYNCNRNARYLSGCTKQFATGQGGVFNVSYQESSYDEAVAYAGITKAMTRFRALDESSLRADWDQTKWPGSRANFGLENSGSAGAPRRLMVFVNTETQSATTNSCGKDTTPDNAQYVWRGATGNGNPEILIGYGGAGYSNCGVFRELGKDMDVVMHEFGHHLVFRGLSNTKQQSVALHEGYADYLTYAVTGNNLLGENTTPGRSSLRSGTTRQRTYSRFQRKSDGSYITVPQALSAPHSVGELWSGMLWEMREELGRDASNFYKMDKIVWDSIDLIKSDGEIYDGVLAVSESAKRYAARFNDDAQQLQSTINNIFVKYEFAAINSDGQLQRTELMAPSTAAPEAQKTSTKSKKWGCGDIALASSGSTGGENAPKTWLIVLILALPLIFPTLAALSRRRVRAPVRVRISKPKN